MPSPRIRIADDHAVIRTGLKYLLEGYFSKVETGEADACATLMAALAHDQYTHLNLDMQLRDCNSLDLIPEILTAHPGLPVMI